MMFGRGGFVAVLLGFVVASSAVTASAEPPRAGDARKSIEALLQQAQHRIGEGKYDEASALVSAASLLLSLSHDSECPAPQPAAAAPARPLLTLGQELSFRR